MRKYIALFMALMLMCGILAGCGEKPITEQKTPPTSQTEISEEEASSNSGSTSNEKGLTLKQIRKAAEDAGYVVSDGHNLVFMKEVKDGFSVQIVADGQDVIYSVIECETEEAAIKNAKEIDDAGYNFAIRNEKFLNCYGTDKKNGIAKDVLSSILTGEPIAKKDIGD